MSLLNKQKNVVKFKKNAANSFQSMVEEVNDIVEQTYYFEQKAFELNKKIEKNKNYISKKLGKRRKLDVRADENLAFSVEKTVNPHVEFYREQLAKNLDKKTYNRVIEKEIKINDFAGLKKLLKQHGVPPKEFKKFIDVEEHVDVESIDELVDSEELGIEDLKGCYTVEFEEKIDVKKVK